MRTNKKNDNYGKKRSSKSRLRATEFCFIHIHPLDIKSRVGKSMERKKDRKPHVQIHHHSMSSHSIIQTTGTCSQPASVR